MQSNLNIGVYGIRNIPSTYSGYETFMTRLLPDLCRLGHSVTLYTRSTASKSKGHYRGVQVRPLPALPFKSLETLSHGALAAMTARLARHDVILAVNVGNSLFTWIHVITGQPVVLNTDGLEWLRGKWGRLGRATFYASGRLAKHTTNALISDCNEMHRIYNKEFGAKSTVIPYSAPISKVSGNAPLPFGLKRGEFFFHAARLNPENNALSTALAYLATSLDRPLVIAGTANYSSPTLVKLKELSKGDSRILLIGHVPDRHTFFSLQHLAAAYIHTHSVGGINPSLLEAMAARARILALDTPFNREALGPDGEYFSCFKKDLPRLFETLDLSPNRDQHLRHQVSERASTVFSHYRVVEFYSDLLRVASAAPKRRNIELPTPWRDERLYSS